MIRAQLAKLKFDDNAQAIDFAMTNFGRGTILIFFAFVLALLDPSLGPIIAICAGLAAYAGKYRKMVVTAGTLFITAIQPYWYDGTISVLAATRVGLQDSVNYYTLGYQMLGLVFVFSVCFLHGVRHFRGFWPFRHPVVTLISLFFALVLLAEYGGIKGMAFVWLWSFINCFGAYIWFLCYACLDQTAKDRSPNYFQFGMFHPFFGSTHTPFGKGAANARKLEAKDKRALAITQLKGIKLAFICFAIKVISAVFMNLVHTQWHIPKAEEALVAFATGQPIAWYICWASMICAFIEAVLTISTWGNAIIAAARIAGFNMLRNTYKPFAARTIADFWNRYYFYFKELLVDLFFFPTFLRCFKDNKRARIAFATFMAASVGNILYHFMKDIKSVLELGLIPSVTGFATYCFYSLVLAAGIIISQLLPRKATTALACVKVWLFYCLLHVFDDIGRTYGLMEHIRFFFHMFGF